MRFQTLLGGVAAVVPLLFSSAVAAPILGRFNARISLTTMVPEWTRR